MSDKAIGLIWSISLMLIGLTTMIISIANVFGDGLPDAPTRVIGIMQLILLPALAGSTIEKIRRDRKRNKK